MTPVPGGAPEAHAPQSRAAEILQRLHTEEGTAGSSATSAEALLTRADFDRSFIAKMVMVVYVGSLSLCLGLLVWHGLTGQGDFAAVSKDFADLIKTAVVPIVTLVLGYYFGRSGRILSVVTPSSEGIRP